MERFWCCPAGFAIALALAAGFLIVKSAVKERKEAQKRMMTRIAEDVVDFINEHQIRKEDIVAILSGDSGCALIWEEVDSNASDK